MAANSETEINLKALQRVDSNIIEIIDNASQVAIYKYERESEKWEVTDIEGSLFLYRRSLYPYHGFIIVNRMSTTNFIESITSDMQFQLQEPYLLYKNHSGDIIGSWFYEDRDLRRITKKIQTIVLTQVSTSRRQRCASESETQPKKDAQDIMTLLTQAHEKYVKNISVNKNMNKNIQESCRNLATHSENSPVKTMNSFEMKSKVFGICSSPQENPISPRRRFLSADSFDDHPVSSLSSAVKETVNEKIKSHSKLSVLTALEDENAIPSKNCDFSGDFPSTPSKDVHPTEFTKECFALSSHKSEDSSAPSRLSPLFSRGEILSPSFSDIGFLEESFESHDLQSPKSNLTKPDSQTAKKNSSLGDWMSIFHSDYEQHSSAIKQAFSSQLEGSSDVVLKIHEAYVSSFKSLFLK